MNCTRCEGSGFLNIEQVPADVANRGPEDVLDWLLNRNTEIENLSCSCHIAPPCQKCEMMHDVQICDCCGNGVDAWYGTPGQHYGNDDPPGPKGPYASNGGLCECH